MTHYAKLGLYVYEFRNKSNQYIQVDTPRSNEGLFVDKVPGDVKRFKFSFTDTINVDRDFKKVK